MRAEVRGRKWEPFALNENTKILLGFLGLFILFGFFIYTVADYETEKLAALREVHIERMHCTCEPIKVNPK